MPSENVMNRRKPTIRDVEERNKLCLENLGLIGIAVRKLHWPMMTKVDFFDEVYSEGFLALMRAAEIWQPGREKFSTYAVAAIRHRIISYMRKRIDLLKIRPNGTRPRRFELKEQPLENVGIRLVDTGDEIRRLNQCLSLLPEKDKQILIYRFFNGMPYKELALKIGYTIEGSRQAVKRITKKLREIFLSTHRR